ncbi:hypothetical protein JEZ13_02060 [bacterium]|nr:hypothetical protein [bacterium]
MTKLIASFHNFADILQRNTEFINTELWKQGDDFDFDVLYILEPVKIGEKNYSIHKPWFRYFKHNFPNTKIIILGFWDFVHPNYIFLFDKKINFSDRTSKALCNISPDNFPLDVLDICDKLSVFFKGHGDSSVFDVLSQTATTSTYLAASSDNQEYLQLFQQELDCLLKRWEKYEAFFRFMPFGMKTTEIIAEIRDISQFVNGKYSKNDYSFDEITHLLKNAINVFNEIDEKYIRN